MEESKSTEVKTINDSFRQFLLTQEYASSNLLESSITLVSVGALILGVSLLQLLSNVSHSGLLKISLIFFLLTIISQIPSFWTSEKAHELAIMRYDEENYDLKANPWSAMTGVLNVICRGSFSLGMLVFTLWGIFTS